MSLIIDALKKTQQLRLNGIGGSPTLKAPLPNKKSGRNPKKQWILIGSGLVSLCILLLVFLRPDSLPLATQTNGAIVPMEKKPYAPAAKKISSEPPKEVLSLPKDEEPLAVGSAPNLPRSGQALNPAIGGTTSKQAATQGSPHARVALSDHPSRPVEEKVPLTTKPPLTEKEGGSLTRQAPEENKLPPPKKTVTEKSSLPIPPMTQNEEPSPMPIAVEQERKKDHTLASEVLTHFNSGVAFYNRKEFSKAIQAYQKVIEMDPTYVEAYNNLGIVYQTMGDVERAFGAYQKSTEVNPRYEKGYNNLGLLFLLQGRYEEAREAFQKALAISSNNIESHINLGILFRRKGQWEKAIESYQKALAIDPLHREAHYNVALLHEQLEDVELAISHYRQFIELSSKSYPELVLRVQRHLNALMKAKNK
jgi:Flp pilus assembly protein TadD